MTVLRTKEDLLHEQIEVPEQLRKANEYAFQKIRREVASFYEVSIEQLSMRCRKREIVFPRQVCQYLNRRFTTLYLKQIAELFGQTDHTTVRNACQTVKDLIQTDETIRTRCYSFKKNYK